jgi:hypothetical protein
VLGLSAAGSNVGWQRRNYEMDVLNTMQCLNYF